jgi:hypothetical protein
MRQTGTVNDRTLLLADHFLGHAGDCSVVFQVGHNRGRAMAGRQFIGIRLIALGIVIFAVEDSSGT